MKIDIIKLSKKELSETKQKGTFLYEKDGEYYFTDRMYNSIFVKVNDKEEKEASPENFDSYIEKLLEVYAYKLLEN